MSLNGVTFQISVLSPVPQVNSRHSYTNWGLILKKRPEISPPKPKTVYVDIPSADGSLDMTESLTGDIAYSDREITMEFNVISARSGWSSLYTTIMSFLHGRRMQIIFDEDPDYYYEGRLEVDEWKSDKRTSIIVIKAKVDPWKYSMSYTRVTNTITSNLSPVSYTNGRMPVIPTIIVSEDCTIAFKGETYDLTAGSNRILNIKFTEGSNNTITYHHDGTDYTTQVRYRQGDF